MVTKLGWLKPTDKVYSTGLVVAGRKVPLHEVAESKDSEKKGNQTPKSEKNSEESKKE